MNEALIRAANTATPTRGPAGVRTGHTARETPSRRSSGPAFGELLAQRLLEQRDIKLSAHARERLEARALTLGAAETERLRAAVDAAAAKGARQSLVMLGDMALIVNIPGRTVITAMESDGARGTVFTNIDSAIIAQGGEATAQSR